LREPGHQALALKKRELMAKPRTKQLVVCVDNDGYPASLEKRKIYVALRDSDAERHGLLRIIDESGDDYLYPKALFRLIDLPEALRRAVLAAA
jgi:hypothetical protein